MVINYMYSHLTFLIEFNARYPASVNSSTIIQQYADWTREIIAPNAIEEYEMHEGLYICEKYYRFLLHLPIQHIKPERIDRILQGVVQFDIENIGGYRNAGRVFPDNSDNPVFSIIAKALTNGNE